MQTEPLRGQPCSVERVEAAREAARTRHAALSPSDFSFLTDLDEEASSASLLFDVGATGECAICASVCGTVVGRLDRGWGERKERCACPRVSEENRQASRQAGA